MHRLVVIADTHVPTRARDLPGPVWAAVEQLGPADAVVHAGDWVDESTLDRLLARLAPAGVPLLACWGNNDGPGLRERLPEVARAVLGGVRLAVVHETGPTPGRDRRMAAAYGADTDLLVFGHSHIPWDSTAAAPDGSTVRLLNPGSPTDRRRQPAPTWLSLTLADGVVHDVQLHRLPVRAAVVPQADADPGPGP